MGKNCWLLIWHDHPGVSVQYLDPTLLSPDIQEVLLKWGNTVGIPCINQYDDLLYDWYKDGAIVPTEDEDEEELFYYFNPIFTNILDSAEILPVDISITTALTITYHVDHSDTSPLGTRDPIQIINDSDD